MKKGTIVLLAVFAVVVGILSGILISSILWNEEDIPFFADIFTGEDNKNKSGDGGSGKDTEKRGKETRAGYDVTNGQRYYAPLVNKGDRNVLLVGEDATSGNFDTIIVASISDSNKTIQLLNFPRDIYLDYSDTVIKKLKEMSPKLYEAKGFQKINAAHTVGARIQYEDGNGKFGNSDIDFLADIMEEVFLISINDYAYVNTKGFREVVDLFGGVEINVPIRMKYDDPVQNLHIDLQPGLQHLDGNKAEWFVRFRQGYDKNGNFKSYSDQFRKENQNEFLKAFFTQHATLKNIGKVNELSKLMSDNIRTSIGGVKDITAYANMLRKAIIGKYTMQSLIIECRETKRIDGIYFDIIRSE